jgi:hypothetical protein
MGMGRNMAIVDKLKDDPETLESVKTLLELQLLFMMD